MTLEEAADSLSHFFPVPMSARQALNLIQPVGEAFREQEEEHQPQLFQQAEQANSQSEPVSLPSAPTIKRRYVEIDGVMAR
jgi:hypothetical protein